jgi:hypothetical protein
MLDVGIRAYDPELGSFLQLDPEGGGYVYCGNSPAKAVDPSGGMAVVVVALFAGAGTVAAAPVVHAVGAAALAGGAHYWCIDNCETACFTTRFILTSSGLKMSRKSWALRPSITSLNVVRWKMTSLNREVLDTLLRTMSSISSRIGCCVPPPTPISGDLGL